MTPEELLSFCQDVRKAGKTGNSGDSYVYFTAIYLGVKYPSMTPPINDREVALEGYELGRQLSKRLK